jgi:hypothetical protein
MNEQAKSDAKVQKRSAYFDEPHEVMVDASLSQAQKVAALETLEQDARQLADNGDEEFLGNRFRAV